MQTDDPELEALLREAGAVDSDLQLGSTRDGGAARGTNADLGDDAPAEDLVPPCARGANAAVYGYDIALLREKPWRQPGANLSDYFNYDFDEASYRAYCAMHSGGRGSVKLRAEEYVAKLFANAAPPAPVAAPRMDGGYYGGAPRGPRPSKCKPCFSFRNGTCTKGEHCIYAHGDEELMMAQAAMQQAYPQQHMMPQPSAEGASAGGLLQPPPSHPMAHRNFTPHYASAPPSGIQYGAHHALPPTAPGAYPQGGAGLMPPPSIVIGGHARPPQGDDDLFERPPVPGTRHQ